MLQTMRGLAQSWVFKSLMAILIVSFGIWGIGDIFRGNPQQRAVARVGKVTITVQDLEAEFKAGMPEARKAMGPDLTEQQARQIGVLDRTLHLMVEHAKFDQETKRLGILVSDETVLTDLASRPEFRTKDGKFNKDLWDKVLQKGGFNERAFITEQSKDFARRSVFDAIAGNAKAPKIMIDNLYQALGGKRILEVLTIHDESTASIAAPDEKVLKDFYQAHKVDFTAPEYRSLTIAKLSTDEISKGITISDDDVKQAYEARTAELTMPEQRDVLQALTQDEEKAKALAAASKDGNLEEAAKKAGINVVKLDRVDETSIIAELYTTIFAMDENQVAGPVQSPLGWHVVQVKKIHPAGKLSFDEAKKNLADTLKKEKAADTVSRKLNELDDELAAGHALEEIADTLAMRLIKIPAIDAQGMTPTGKAPDEMPAAEDTRRYAYEQGAGEASQVITDKDGNYVVVRTDEIAPAHVEAFDKVQEKVLAAWRAEQQSKQASTQAEEIAKEMRDGKEAASFAIKSGIDIRISKPISMLGDTDKDLPKQIIPLALKMKEGEVITSATPGAHYVLRLVNIEPVDPAKADLARSKVADELKDRLPLDLLDQYAKALDERYPTEINQELLNSLKQRGS